MRHRKKFEDLAHPDSEGSWAISYGDMLTLITAFFIIFFSADKFHKKPSSSTSLIAETKSFSQGGSVWPEQWLDPLVATRLQARMQKEQGRFFVEFFGQSFFPSGRPDLHPDAKKKLDEFFALYEPYMGQYRIAVTAFSDPRPLKENTRKKYRDNLQLSALRALEMVRYLEKKGVPLAQMRIQGFGELNISKDHMARFGLREEELIRRPASEQKKILHDYARTALIILEPKSGGDL
jgi:flagellar motor protein MotB